MKPLRLLEKNEIERIQLALKNYYTRRPDEYPYLDQDKYDSYASFIEQYATDKNSTVLDIGSGTWQIPFAIAKRGYQQVIGCDFFSPKILNEYNVSLAGTTARVEAYDGLRIPLPDGSADVVSSLNVFEHISNVEHILEEINRVLKPNGRLIIMCPNWSGPHSQIRALQAILFREDRYWQYETASEALWALCRSIGWYFANVGRTKPVFLLVYPRMKAGQIDFERSDDDVVHLCQPLSFKKYFRLKGYKLLKYNQGEGESGFARIFNTIFPSFATTITLVAKK
jgi:SAM-dependent methyltransferase